MSRFLVFVVLPLILPMGVFATWLYMARKADKQGRKELWPSLERGPWFWLIILGFALAVGTLLFFGSSNRNDPDDLYRPPVFKDGKIEPGRMIKRE